MSLQRRAPSFGNDVPFDALVRATQDQPVLAHIAEAVQPAVRSALGRSRALKDALHGVWVGHPLHPVLTDLPIGAWTMAAIFDALHLLDRLPRSAYAADTCVAAGIAGAVAAAVTGIADWSETSGRTARNGLVHAASNSLGLACYVASLALRKRRRGTGMLLSLAGYACAGVGAGLGGHLVFGEAQGVDHARTEELPERWTRVIPIDELNQLEPHRAMLGAHAIVLVRADDGIYALLDRCAHLGGPLSQGEVRDGCITCPWHGSTFALADGHVVSGPAVFSQPTLEARVVERWVEVRAFEPEAP